MDPLFICAFISALPDGNQEKDDDRSECQPTIDEPSSTPSKTTHGQEVFQYETAL